MVLKSVQRFKKMKSITAIIIFSFKENFNEFVKQRCGAFYMINPSSIPPFSKGESLLCLLMEDVKDLEIV